MPAMLAVFAGLAGILIGIGVGYALRRRALRTSVLQAEEDARRILAEAETRSHALDLETREETLKLRNDAEADIREHRADLSRFLLSPMPGMIVSLAVAAGQAVKSGEPLCVVDAMKMENVLRAERDATVAKIEVAPGDPVRVDQVIMTFA